MPIRIPSGLYARGADINTTPFTNAVVKDITAKDVAKKAAKDALIKSTDALKKNLTYAGIRPQDQKDFTDPADNKLYPGIETRSTQWYNNAISGNVDMTEYRNLLNDIETSKQRIKTQDDLTNAVLNNKVDADLDDVHVISKIELPLQYPGSRKDDNTEYKLSDMPAFVPKLDRVKWYNSIIGSAKPQERIAKKIYDSKTRRYFIPKEFTIAEEKAFGDAAASYMLNDKSAIKEFKNMLTDPSFIEKAIPIYKQVYGEDYSQNPAGFTIDKVAKVDAILEARKRKDVVSYDKPTDPYALAKFKSGLSRTGGGKGAIDEYINNLSKTAEPLTVNNKPFVGLTISGKTYGGKLVQMTPDLINTFTIDPGLTSEKIPYGMLFTDDGKYVIPTYFQKGEEGGYIPTESGASYKLEQTKFSKPIPMPQFRAIIGKSLGETTSGNLRARDIADEDVQGTKTTYTSEGSKQQGKTPKQVTVPELNNYMTD